MKLISVAVVRCLYLRISPWFVLLRWLLFLHTMGNQFALTGLYCNSVLVYFMQKTSTFSWIAFRISEFVSNSVDCLSADTVGLSSADSMKNKASGLRPNFQDFSGHKTHKSNMALLDLYSGCGGMSTGLCLGARLAGVNLVTVNPSLILVLLLFWIYNNSNWKPWCLEVLEIYYDVINEYISFDFM